MFPSPCCYVFVVWNHIYSSIGCILGHCLISESVKKANMMMTLVEDWPEFTVLAAVLESASDGTIHIVPLSGAEDFTRKRCQNKLSTALVCFSPSLNACSFFFLLWINFYFAYIWSSASAKGEFHSNPENSYENISLWTRTGEQLIDMIHDRHAVVSGTLQNVLCLTQADPLEKWMEENIFLFCALNPHINF